jgi:hypothetical protein
MIVILPNTDNVSRELLYYACTNSVTPNLIWYTHPLSIQPIIFHILLGFGIWDYGVLGLSLFNKDFVCIRMCLDLSRKLISQFYLCHMLDMCLVVILVFVCVSRRGYEWFHCDFLGTYTGSRFCSRLTIFLFYLPMQEILVPWKGLNNLWHHSVIMLH